MNEVIYKIILYILRNVHLTSENKSGNISGNIGNLVLLSDKLKEITAVNRHKKRVRQIDTDIFLDNICSSFVVANTLLFLSSFVPVVGKDIFKEGDEVMTALVDVFYVVVEWFKR